MQLKLTILMAACCLLFSLHTHAQSSLAASEKFRGKGKRGLNGDVMMEIDWSVGEVMNALKRNTKIPPTARQ